MRRFNPEKELRKIQKGNKNKVIFSIMALLLIIAIGSSYALYQIRYSKQIIYTTVAPFYSKDIQISLYVDGEKDTTSETFPTKDSGKIFSHMTCENGSSGVFDNTKWELELKITKQDKCNVYFVTGNLPNAPELYQGMIPVVYDEKGNIYVADIESDWYNYQDHRWGNAVLVDASQSTIKDKYFNGTELKEDIAGTKISMDEILQMYVWIPRYKYELFNVDNQGVEKQIINIKFEQGTDTTGNIKCTYTNNGDGTITEDCKDKTTQDPVKNKDWYTHPAFTFKGTTEDSGTELKGIWVGKFEPSDPTDITGRVEDVIGGITILPDKTSMGMKRLGTMFRATRNIEVQNAEKYNLNADQIDTHVMKNIEWGAVAYLTQSVYGIYTGDGEGCIIDGMNKETCEVWINNANQGTGVSPYTNGGTYTGCVGDSVSAEVQWNTESNQPAQCAEKNRWNTGGVKASTTGNMYGIYDMSGGVMEYVMGVLVNQTGELYLEASQLQSDELKESKYYDIYTLGSSGIEHGRGHLGDATRETLLKFGIWNSGWNDDTSTFPYVTSDSPGSWFIRGGMYTGGVNSSLFSFQGAYGGMFAYVNFRPVLSAT